MALRKSPYKYRPNLELAEIEKWPTQWPIDEHATTESWAKRYFIAENLFDIR